MFLKLIKRNITIAEGTSLSAPSIPLRAGFLTQANQYLPEFVYGAIDGIITTFAVVAGAAGAQLSIQVVLILGFANLVADGLSMSVGAYLAKRAEQDDYLNQFRNVEHSLDKKAESYKNDLSEKYLSLGLEANEIRGFVAHLASKKNAFCKMILVELHDILPDNKSAFWAGFATFFAFLLAGALPLLAFIVSKDYELLSPFQWSSLLTGFAFILIGFLKHQLCKGGMLKSIAETLFLGLTAAAASYYLGHILEKIVYA